MKSLLSISLLLATLGLAAQGPPPEDTAAFKVGLYVGYYIPNDGPAQYYNASDNGRLVTLMNQPQIKNRIMESLDGYTFSLAEYAQDMAYQNSVSVELEASYNFGNGWAFTAHLHNVRLTAGGIFTLRVDRVDPNQSVVPQLEQAEIMGKERRSHIDFGLAKRVFMEGGMFALFEGGLDLNFTEVEENKMQIAGRTYALQTYTNPLNPQATGSTTFGSGFYAVSGLGFQLPSQYGFLVKATYIRTKIDVNEVLESSTNIFIPSVGFTKSF